MPSRTVRLLAAIVACCTLFPVLARGQTPFDIHIIDVDSWVNGGIVNDTNVFEAGTSGIVGVWVDSASGPGTPIGGFEFFLGYPTEALLFDHADPGPDLHPAWEYFTWRNAAAFGDTCAACPSGVIRLVGITDLASGGTPPDAAFHLGGCIATLEFFASADIAQANCHPITFCTKDCTDNTISSKDGSTLYIPSSGTSVCPGYSAEACTTGSAGTVIPYADFHVGMVCIAPPVNDHGDLNLNGITNEIADMVLYTNFLIGGWGIFSSYDTVRFLNSEINCDGAAGTTVDLAYMSGIIHGTLQPIEVCPDPAIPPDTTWSAPTPSLADTLLVPPQSGFPDDTVTVDIYLRNLDTVGVFDFRLRYDPAVIEPVTETIPLYGSVYPLITQLLRGEDVLISAGGVVLEPGVLVYAATEFDPQGSAFVPGAGATVRTLWHILPGTNPGATPISLENDPDWPATYNTIASRSATVWKRPELVDGQVTVLFNGCSCPAQCDMYADGHLDALDLNNLIDYILFSGTGGMDPDCPTERADFNFDGIADALDLNALIQHLFYGGPPPCNPCYPVQASCQ